MQKQETVVTNWMEDLLAQAKAKGDYKEYQQINEAI
jgi:hypothetical protein